MSFLIQQKLKGGVLPPWEWAVVQRCGGAAGGARNQRQVHARGAASAMLSMRRAACCLPHETDARCCTCCRPAADGSGLAGKRLPMGALRASLGHMSRFEDVAALLAFLSAHYTDAVAEVATAPTDDVPLQLPGAAVSPAAVGAMASC